MKTNSILFLLLLLVSKVNAQTTMIKGETMADTMRSNGKIYVVVAVVTTILIGLIAYLFRIEKKISSLENELINNNQ